MSSLDKIEPGDRVEYVLRGLGLAVGVSYGPINMEEYVAGYGTVIDVIPGVAGVAEIIVSRQDGSDPQEYRFEFRVVGERRPTVRLARGF